MKMYHYDKSHVDRGTATLRNAVDSIKNRPNSHRLLAEDHDSCYLYNQQELSCSAIQSKLIEYVGRYCESFGSDLICTLCDLDAFIGSDATEDDEYGRWIIGVGIRESGVDHNAWIMSNLKNSQPAFNGYCRPESYYRKVLAINIEDDLVKDHDGDYYRNRSIELYDITHDLYKIAEEDE